MGLSESFGQNSELPHARVCVCQGRQISVPRQQDLHQSVFEKDQSSEKKLLNTEKCSK